MPAAYILRIVNDDTVLLHQLASGSTEAFREVFDIYKDLLFTFVVGLTHSQTEAEEVVQDVFMKIWESRTNLSHVQNLKQYIYRMARNKTLDHLAAKSRRIKLTQELWSNMQQSKDVTQEILAARESHRLINEAISQLSERKQQILQLSREQGMSHDEIATHLGISKQTIKNTLSEALKQVKAYLDEHSALVALCFWLTYFPAVL